jgi:hypothetical protein
MRQNQVGKNRLVEAHRTILDEALQILLESAMRKLGTENLVLTEEQKEDRRSDANDGNGLGKGARDFAHHVLQPSE